MDALLHSVPPSYSRPSPVHTSDRDSRILTGKSESVSCVVTAPFSLGPGAYKILFVSFNSLFPQSCVRCPLLECLCCTQVCCTQCPHPTVGHHQCTLLTETPEYSQASLTQSLVGPLLIFPGSWCTQGFVCALQECISPVLWKFCNQNPLALKVKFLGGSQPLFWIPRLENLLWALELS